MYKRNNKILAIIRIDCFFFCFFLTHPPFPSSNFHFPIRFRFPVLLPFLSLSLSFIPFPFPPISSSVFLLVGQIVRSVPFSSVVVVCRFFGGLLLFRFLFHFLQYAVQVRSFFPVLLVLLSLITFLFFVRACFNLSLIFPLFLIACVICLYIYTYICIYTCVHNVHAYLLLYTQVFLISF